MMWTFDKINLGKDPPNFPMLLKKTSGDGYEWTVRITHFAESSVIFFFDFKNMSGKRTSTNSGGKNSLIQKL